MINKLMEIIFSRKIKLVADINGFYKFRNYSDGIKLIEYTFDCDFYLQDHNPKLTISLAILNFYLFYFEIYNIYHANDQQRVCKYD